MRYLKWAIAVAALVIGIFAVFPEDAKSATQEVPLSLTEGNLFDSGGAFPEMEKPKVPTSVSHWNGKARIAQYLKGRKVIVTKRLNTQTPSKPIVEGSRAIFYKNMAYAPSKAPESIKKVIWSGNKIHNLPYVWGGGHGSWSASGYDCSGSVSYALHGAKLLNTTMVSGDFASWGESGSGKWITIYANGGHAYMTVAGLRFDTSGANPSRWQPVKYDNSGYSIRHPANL